MINLNEKVTFESNHLNTNVLTQIQKMDHVLSVQYNDPVCHVLFERGNGNLVSLINFLSENKIQYDSLSSQRPTLNDVFLELTGKDLRD